jgi:predicted nucleic acid-binding protein
MNQEIYVKVYLDVCCLCRPFDDQLIPRIRYESEAVIAILNRCSRDWELIWSSAITYEIAKIIDHNRKHYVSTFAAKTTTNILVDIAIKERAAKLMNLGVKALDALHIACAERAGATVLITTDDIEKHYEPPQRYNLRTNRKSCRMV